ncbi:DLW-39 family protein [Lipingzhangella sp. LS1_29]|uniref:DLW-39 family protein n=1 Tax=Lipingzhangella rawalii TaxID=2055835 RepID=A0ABU2HDJ9_9ACTN|nr:DLW-39 family protein [Lipingzhangella rawalii]MDS1272644.1 DLW-39 family protein [Lipingzhangella rawalii]
MKKLIVLALVALGAFVIYRKLQADRAEMDLWSEAGAASDN